MTVSAGSNKVILAGDGVTGPPGNPFSLGLSFIGVAGQYVQVILTLADGTETVLSPTNYTLLLTGGTPPAWGIGGTLAYPLTGPALGVGATITVVRVLPLAQAITLQNQASYGAYASAAEQALDLGVMIEQQIGGSITHALVTPQSDPDANLTIPNKTQRALQMLGFDSAGNAIAAQPSSALVSTVMQPVVAASTLAAARALMGIDISSLLPIGMEVDWPGLGGAPPLWLYEDGSLISRVTYPELLNVLAPAVTATITSASNAITGMSVNTTGWATGWIIESPNFTVGTTVASITGPNSITTSNPALSNGTTFRVFPHGNGDGVNTFALPDMTGRVAANLDTGGATLPGATAIGAAIGNKTQSLVTNNLPPYTPLGDVSQPTASYTQGGVPGVAVFGNNGSNHDVATAGAGPFAMQPLAITVTKPNFTGTAQGGTSAAFAIVQPTSIRRTIIYAGH